LELEKAEKHLLVDKLERANYHIQDLTRNLSAAVNFGRSSAQKSLGDILSSGGRATEDEDDGFIPH
jgi:hypothetical protein